MARTRLIDQVNAFGFTGLIVSVMVLVVPVLSRGVSAGVRRLRLSRPRGLLVVGFLLPLTAACGLQAQTSAGVTRTATVTAAATAAPAAPIQSSNELRALQNEFVSVVKTVGPSVVQIETKSGLGSGIIFDSQGDIVTNNHVVGSSRTFAVTLASGKQYSGRLIGTFAADDLAVIKIDGTGFPAATFADSSKLEVGDIVMAIGNPLGLQSSVTEGIVSAVGRTLSEQTGATLTDLIQTSAAINPGNSGGALVDLQGRVVGIPTLAAVQQGSAAPGIGFAIPSNTARDIAGQLVQSGRVTNSHRAYLGVRLATTSGGSVLIQGLVAGGPAAKAGLVAGDVITAIDGHPATDTDAVSTILAGLRPGDTASVAVEHSGGGRATVKVVLGEFPG